MRIFRQRSTLTLVHALHGVLMAVEQPQCCPFSFSFPLTSRNPLLCLCVREKKGPQQSVQGDKYRTCKALYFVSFRDLVGLSVGPEFVFAVPPAFLAPSPGDGFASVVEEWRDACKGVGLHGSC